MEQKFGNWFYWGLISSIVLLICTLQSGAHGGIISTRDHKDGWWVILFDIGIITFLILTITFLSKSLVLYFKHLRETLSPAKQEIGSLLISNSKIYWFVICFLGAGICAGQSHLRTDGVPPEQWGWDTLVLSIVGLTFAILAAWLCWKVFFEEEKN